MNEKLFKNPQELDENPSDDFLDRSEEVLRVAGKIDWLVKNKTQSINAYIGSFGSGKSSILQSVSKTRKKYIWHTFELWRYANREKIWDGFVIELSSKILYKDTIDIADELEDPGNKQLRFIQDHKAYSFTIVFLVWLITSGVVWSLLQKNTNDIANMVRAILKYATTILFLVWALIGLDSLFSKQQRPLRRIFEMEDYFATEVLSHLKRPLIVVIEDVDRTSSDEGTIFLETLSVFLKAQDKKNRLQQSVVVIAPQDVTAFDILHNNNAHGYQRSLKIYDYEFYQSQNIEWNVALTTYFDKLGVIAPYKDDLKMAAESIASTFPTQFNMRLMKRLLRIVNEFIDANPTSSPAIAFTVASTRYLSVVKPYGSNGELETVASSIQSRSTEVGHIKVFGNVLKNICKLEVSIRRFSLTFEDMSDEFRAEPVRHPNGEVDGKFVINKKYEILL